MTKMDYLELLVDEIHSTTVATIGSDGHPQTRIIDMMYYDEEGVYFLTAKGKDCIGCKLCYSVCPQKCIDISSVPVTINQNHCLHCGRCAEICPRQCIEKRG